MPSASLIAHPAKPSKTITRVDVDMTLDADALRVVYRVYGKIDGLTVPDKAAAERTDGLWRTTCGELFLQLESRAYLEFNFSPSTQWAAYRFDDYRAGMRPFDVESPHIVTGAAAATDCFVLDARLTLSAITLTGRHCSPTCVIAERDGTISYWALAHESAAPDFHDAVARQIVL